MTPAFVQRNTRVACFSLLRNNVCLPLQRRLHYILLSTLIVSVTACNSNAQKDSSANADTVYTLPSPTLLSTADSTRFHNAVEGWYDSMLKRRGFNGGIIVAKKGSVVFEAYNGSQRLDGKEPITDSTSLHIASVSKTFTAMAVLKLAQDNLLDIDDSLVKYFPTFNYPGVTIKDLLNHRSGLPNYVHFMETVGWNKKVFMHNQDVYDYLVNKKDQLKNIGRPGRSFTYCNTNYALLALLIEKVTGKTYPAYLQQTFFDPLQMQHTFVFDSSKINLVPPSFDGHGLVPYNFLDLVYGDKNIYTTPHDLLIWDRALSVGNIFAPATLEQAYTPYSNERPGVRNYGLGWRMNNYPSGKKMIFHNGWWHGSNAAFIRLTEDSATIIVIGNKYNSNIYHAKDLINIFGNYFAGSGRDEEESEASTPVAPPSSKPGEAVFPIPKEESVASQSLKAKLRDHTKTDAKPQPRKKGSTKRSK